jgi:hypothetical protein
LEGSLKGGDRNKMIQDIAMRELEEVHNPGISKRKGGKENGCTDRQGSR